MGKFKITYGTTNIIPEDSGWVWSSENITEPTPRYKFVTLAGANGRVDLSKVASGSLLYDTRTITVTLARFKKGHDGWMTEADTLTDSIKTAFANGGVSVYPKTENKGYGAYGFNWSISRDGIIQFLTLTFTCMPLGFTPS